MMKRFICRLNFVYYDTVTFFLKIAAHSSIEELLLDVRQTPIDFIFIQDVFYALDGRESFKRLELKVKVTAVHNLDSLKSLSGLHLMIDNRDCPLDRYFQSFAFHNVTILHCNKGLTDKFANVASQALPNLRELYYCKLHAKDMLIVEPFVVP